MATYKSTFTTSNLLAARRVVDMKDSIIYLQPSSYPLLTITKKLSKVVATNPKVSWLEKEKPDRWDAVNSASGYTAGAVTIKVDYEEKFGKYHILKVPRTGETMLVTASSATDSTITATRAFGETTAAALLDNDPVVSLGASNAEEATSETPVSTQAVEAYNYTMIKREPFSGSGTVAESELYGGPQRDVLQKEHQHLHYVDIERQILFGELKWDTTAERRQCRGIVKTISTNVDAIDGQLTEAEFEEHLRDYGFKYSSTGNLGKDTKFMYSSLLALSSISEWARDKIRMKPRDKTYGINIQEYLSPAGTLNLVYHPLLEGAIYGGYGLILDMKNLFYRPFKNRDTKLYENIQANDQDGWKDEYKTEFSFQMEQEKHHSKITGITA